MLFKTHKGLPASQKVSSLYVFDALVRAAHSYVVKHSVVADSTPGKGNAATFLAKIEGIVEGLFEDMISSGAPEAQVSSSIKASDPSTSKLFYCRLCHLLWDAEIYIAYPPVTPRVVDPTLSDRIPIIVSCAVHTHHFVHASGGQV